MIETKLDLNLPPILQNQAKNIGKFNAYNEFSIISERFTYFTIQRTQNFQCYAFI